MKKESNNTQNAHDKLFKAVFSKRREAANLLRNFGDPVLVKGLDFRTLKREQDSFIESDLKEYFSDLVYSCRWKGKELRICLLFEHKSYPVDYPHFQLLRYMLNCWEQDLNHQRALRPVIPIIVYHGNQKWKHRNLYEYFEIPDDDLLTYFPNFDYHLLDLSKYEDENILSLETGFYVNTLFLLKHQKQKAFILAHLKEIFMNKEEYLTNQEGQYFLKTALHYLYKTNKFDKNQKSQLMKSIFYTPVEDLDPDNIDNTFDEMVLENYQKGIKEGKEISNKQHILKTLQKFPDWTDKEVAEFIGVSVEKILEIRKKISL